MKLALATSLIAYASAFSTSSFGVSRNSMQLNALFGDNLEAELERELDYKPGVANGDLAKRFGHLSGVEVKTVGEAFSDFTERLGCTLNALYKNTVTDMVGSTHLTVVDARFKRDPLWSLGLIAAMEFILKNYPERDVAAKIVTCMIESVGMNEAELRAEADSIIAYVDGKSAEDITAELSASEGTSPLTGIATTAKDDQFWMYSRFFGIGLVKISEAVGVDQNQDTVGQQVEKWMTAMDKPTFTAMSDSDQWFRIKGKLDMMETLMKEIEIREKKRMADRLEEKAELALAQAEREKEFEALKNEESENLQSA